MRIGSLFSGAGGLDMAVEQVFGGDVVWHSEVDPAASKVLAHRWPGIPNHHDITKVDWAQVEPVDLLCGGWPCQPFSAAGRRGGVNDVRHLWPYVAEAMSFLRPPVAVFENVSGHLTLGFDEVIRDIEILDYTIKWCLVKASDIGAPHQRARLFLLAKDRHGQLCGGPDRRRRVHRDSILGRFVSDTAEGVDVRQGTSGPVPHGAAISGKDQLRAQAERPEPSGCLHLATDGNGCSGGHPADSAILDDQGRACGYCSGIPADGGRIHTAAQWPCDMDRRDAESGGYVRRPDSRSQSQGAGRETANNPGTGDLSGRLMVGTERRPLRPDPIRGALAEERADGGRQTLRTEVTDYCRSGGGATLTHSPRDGWDEGRPESARLFGGSDAAVSGDGPLLPTPVVNDIGEGKTVEWWDEWCAKSKAKHGNGNGHGNSLAVLSTPRTSDTNGVGVHGDGGLDLRTAVTLLPTPTAVDANGARNATSGRSNTDSQHHSGTTLNDVAYLSAWGKYEPAIRRWEHVTRLAPVPTEPNRNGNPRLSAAFSEWMLGWPAGWVTQVPGITRNDQLRIIGNGVVPQQASAALRYLLTVGSRLECRADSAPATQKWCKQSDTPYPKVTT